MAYIGKNIADVFTVNAKGCAVYYDSLLVLYYTVVLHNLVIYKVLKVVDAKGSGSLFYPLYKFLCKLMATTPIALFVFILHIKR